ncbi:hypothetical protein [Nitrosomonas sp.]
MDIIEVTISFGISIRTEVGSYQSINQSINQDIHEKQAHKRDPRLKAK